MIEVVISRLSRSIRDYETEVFSIEKNRHKKKSMDDFDLEPFYEENVESLTSL